jgi:serine protease Do
MNKIRLWLLGSTTGVLVVALALLAVFYVRLDLQHTDSTAVHATASLTPAVVRIDGSGTGFQKSGSGTIVDKRGYVITNQHVIADDTAITITVGQTAYDAQVIASDATVDLALLKIQSTNTNFPTVPFGTASDIVPGTTVISIGFPLGENFAGPVTVTEGGHLRFTQCGRFNFCSE